MDDLLFIVLILAVIWYWWDTQQSNEIALAVCKQKCNKEGLQLLDATVIRQRSWLRRSPKGFLQICRLYSFDYYNEISQGDGDTAYGRRENAYIVLIGKQVVETNMRHHESDVKIVH